MLYFICLLHYYYLIFFIENPQLLLAVRTYQLMICVIIDQPIQNSVFICSPDNLLNLTVKGMFGNQDIT